MKNDPIMSRIKNNYENRSKTFLTRRTPVIIRLDGKAFHTYTRGLDKPFDEGLIEDMQQAAIYLCKNIQGAKCAYVQSDEISILVTDYDTLQTDAWFDYNVQKMTSVSASLATGIFNQVRTIRSLKEFSEEGGWEYAERGALINVCDFIDSSVTLANFDSRVFNIPKEEVANYFLARQKDAVKNSIAMLAQSLYSHGKEKSELFKKNQSEMQEMCFQKGHNWNDLHFSKKRGSFIVKNIYADDKLVNCFGENTYEDTSTPSNIEDIWFDEEEYWKVYSPEIEPFDQPLIEWEGFKPAKIRTKWEIVETPLTFSDSDFKKWL